MSCRDCFIKPKYPDIKCCYNCGKICEACDTVHVCGVDCDDWTPKDEDVVKVVRCKDCKHGEADYGVNDDIVNPFQYRCTYEGDTWNRPMHFCSYGERKEGAEE